MYTFAAKDQAPKDSRSEEPKAQGPELLTTPQCLNNLKLSAKVWQEKKKYRCRQYKQQQKSSTPAIEVNAAQLEEPNYNKKDQNCLDRTACSFSQIKFYNSQKLGYYVNNYPKLKN